MRLQGGRWRKPVAALLLNSSQLGASSAWDERSAELPSAAEDTVEEGRQMLLEGLLQVEARQPENHTCRTIHNCCKGSDMTISETVWEHVKAFASNYHVRELLDSTPRMLERHYTFLNFYTRLRVGNFMQVYAHDCYFGVLSILLNAIPAAEFEFEAVEVQRMFALVDQMLLRNNDLAAANWTIPFDPMVISWPFLLGLRPTTCHETRLRIYVYDTGKYSAGSVFCSAGQWGVEVMLHRYLASSACRTHDPSEADFFFVPDYRACHFHLAPTHHHKGLTRIEGDDYHSSIIWDHKSKYRHPQNADATFIDLVKSLEHFPVKGGLDHIFVFSDQGFIVNFTHTFPSWRDHISHSIFATTEAFTPGCGPSCFLAWKDILIPGHLDWERIEAIRNKSKPTSERRLLFNFHGRMPANHDYYQNNTVRGELLKFAQFPDVSVGGFVEEYFDIMGDSHFCLIPEGTSSWTNHLYESFFAGCIPFILSDRFVLPFQDLIDWGEVSIRWPQESVTTEMYAYMRNLVDNHRGLVEAMKQKLEASACWFDFYAFDSVCSPYRAFLHGLEQRKLSRPRYLHPQHWGP